MIQERIKERALLLVNVVNGKFVIHTRDIEKHIIISIYSFVQMRQVVSNYIISNTNYFVLEKEFKKGKYRISIETKYEKKEKIIII